VGRAYFTMNVPGANEVASSDLCPPPVGGTRNTRRKRSRIPRNLNVDGTHPMNRTSDRPHQSKNANSLRKDA
jgi:hypothetical protein